MPWKGKHKPPAKLVVLTWFDYWNSYFMFWYLTYMLEGVSDKINEKYFYKINDDELDYINDILYERKKFKKKYEIIKKGSNRYIDYPPLTKIRKKKKCNELEIYSYYHINKISFDEIDIDCCECKIWK